MEKSEEQQLRLEICQKCYQHQHYDNHSQKQYQQAYDALKCCIEKQLLQMSICRNVPPKYLRKAANTKNSSKRYTDTNSSKIVEFPFKGSFQLYYKSILIYSKQQSLTFPDFNYLALVLKCLQCQYRTNPLILNNQNLQKFRDVQYQFKKNTEISQSLYTFIKANACGNASYQCINQILYQLFNTQGSESFKKKKSVLPYSMFDGLQKKFKIKNIYCPKSPVSNFINVKTLVSRPMSSTATNRGFAKHQQYSKSKQLSQQKNEQKEKKSSSQFKNIDRPDSSAPKVRLKSNNSHYWTQRQTGLIVKNNINKNQIFQLVIKQNKTINEQKLKQLMKEQKFFIQQQPKITKTSKNALLSKKKQLNQNKTIKHGNSLPGSFKSTNQKKNKSKQVFISYLNGIKEKNNKTNLFQAKQNKYKKSPMKEQRGSKIQKKEHQIIDKNQSNVDNNYEYKLSNSSRFGSIKRNRFYQSQNQKVYQKSNDIQQLKKLASTNDQKLFKIIKVSQKKQSQIENCTEKHQNENKQQNLCLIPVTIQNQQKQCKQQHFSRIRKQIIVCNQIQSRYTQKQQKTVQLQQNNDNGQSNECLKNNQQSNQYAKNSELQQSDFLQKRASIEQATVQKRISQRKRSSCHERHLIQIQKVNEDAVSAYENQNIKVGQQNYDGILDDNHNQQPNYQEQWQTYSQQINYVRKPALIIRKFAQEENFTSTNQYSTEYDTIRRSPHGSQVEFFITGQELLSNFVVKSIQQLYKPYQIKLFPQIFKQVQVVGVNMNQNSTFSSVVSSNPLGVQHYFHCHKSKLIYVANLMLRSNPLMISRMFEDKKVINPYGVYCVWLRNPNGRFQPVFVNDFFAFQTIKNSQGRQSYKPVYSWLSNQNSIWYMILEKAVAKLLGGYHIINQTSLSQLMSIVMASPTVDVGYLNPLKAHKIFDQKIFYNKMANIYSLRQGMNNSYNTSRQMKRIDRVIGFSYNRRDPKSSAVHVKIQQSTTTMQLREFLLSYGQISLLFFNNNYFLNQTCLKIDSAKRQVLSCRLISENSKNNCYMMFSKFPQKFQTKVTLYRQLSDQQAKIKQGMNPLSQQNRRYEYIGQITKTGNFFFEVQINGGEYICLMQSSYQIAPFFSIFSQYPIVINQINTNELKKDDSEIKKMKNLKKSKASKRKQKFKDQQQKQNQIAKQFQTPKIILEHRIPIRNLSDERTKNQKQNNCIAMNQIKIRKQYAYLLDNIYEIEQQLDKQQQQQLVIHKEKSVKKRAQNLARALQLANINQDKSQKTNKMLKQLKKSPEDQYQFLLQNQNPKFELLLETNTSNFNNKFVGKKATAIYDYDQ